MAADNIQQKAGDNSTQIGIVEGNVNISINITPTASVNENLAEIVSQLQNAGIIGDEVNVDTIRSFIERWYQQSRETQSKLISEIHSSTLEETAHFLQVKQQAHTNSVKLSQLIKRLHNFYGGIPQPMMINETVSFVFGGEAGKMQPPIHIMQALREEKVKINFEGVGSFSEMKAFIERGPSFPQGPLNVVIPAGTCISPDLKGGLDFPSIDLSPIRSEISRCFYVD